MTTFHKVFPTRVGMNRHKLFTCAVCMGVPHSRGDEPRQNPRHARRLKCSPLAWG